MDSLAMPFNETTGGVDAQTLLSMISAINSRMDRIDQRLDRIIETQHQSAQNHSSLFLSGSQFVAMVAIGVVILIIAWMAIYYGGNAG